MSIFVGFKIKRSINTLLSLQNSSGPEVSQAIGRLRQIGKPAIPKLLEALSQTRQRERVIAVLATMLSNDTLPLFLAALPKASARISSGILETFTQSEHYDVNRLLSLFSNARLDKAELEKVFVRHKRRLQPEALLRLLSTTSKDTQVIILRLLEQVATPEVVPELLYSVRSDDPTVRVHIVRILSQFNTGKTQEALVRLLSDSHKSVRLAVLDGLAASQDPFDVAPVCRLVRDPDPTVRTKAIDLLLNLLQHQSEQLRRRAVEGLSAASNTGVVKDLMEALKDKEWWVTVRVADALGTNGGTRIIDATLMLLRDSDTFIRQCAFEILQTIKDERAFNSLVHALRDKKIRESAVEAMAALGDKRAVPMFINMLEGDPEACLIAIRALVALSEPQAVHPLIVQLQNPNKTVRQEALRALAVLTNEEYAPDVLQAVMAVRDGGEAEIKELANRMATTIIKRFGQKVMPRNTLTESSMQALLPLHEMPSTPAPQDSGPTSLPSRSQGDAVAPPAEQTTGGITDVTSLEPGMILTDRYRVIRRVGQGNFSIVFLVHDTMVHEDMILKILSPQVALDDTMIKRFIHELRYARKVTHENVIRIHDFITLGKLYAISMEYFPSHNLAEELRIGGPMDLKRGLKIIWDICRGIGAAHIVNVVHRDLKPPNILINDAGIVKIVDFGVAAVTSDMATRLTRVGTLLGTPAYMAPEQVRSRTIDARTDIYSLGVIMYEIFTGRPPYIGEDMSVLFQHVEGKPTPPRKINAELAPELEEIILKAMAVDPEQRFQTIDALRKSLVEFARKKR